jgi:tripartite-type tricarboxylate transporter receptor subunit TctC
MRAAAVFAAAALFAASAAAQTWPSKPVTIVYGTAAGGPLDLISRVIALQWEKKLGQKVIVENRPGASSTLAGAVVARAPGDGHTLLNGSFPPVGIFIKELSFDPFKDLAPATILGTNPYNLLVSRKMNIATLKDFISHAKANPGIVSVGVVTAGPHEIETNAMLEALGVQANLIGYKGTATVYPALVSGELNAAIGGTPPQLQSGEILALAVGSSARNRNFPDVPTFREAGIAYEPRAIFPIFAPGTTPRELLNRISAELVAVARSEEFTERITKTYGIVPLGTTPEGAVKIIRDDYDTGRRIAARIGIKPQ